MDPLWQTWIEGAHTPSEAATIEAGRREFCGEAGRRGNQEGSIDMAHPVESDGLRLLSCINDTQARGQEGARVDSSRAAQEIGLDVGSERYHDALRYLLDEAALLGDEHTSTEPGTHSPGYAGHAVYFFTRRAVKLLEERDEDWRTMLDPDNPEPYPEPY